MSQRERVLRMLKDAGPEGVRSDAFVAAYMPRAAARVKELRDAGYEITSEQEKQFVRYRLQDHQEPGGKPADLKSSVDPRDITAGGSVAESRLASAGGPNRPVPSMFDPDVSWEGAA